MTGRSSCPDGERYRQLIEGSLGEAEQAELAQHLERCAACREAYEKLAGASLALSDPHSAGAEGPSAEPELDRMVQRLLAQGGPDAAEDAAHEALAFLRPSHEPGHLGRLGPYEILEVVGHGGMGVVFKALDSRLHRLVAVKVLAPQWAANVRARRRFLREARAAAAVSHDHVVTIHAVDEAEGLPFLVMEYVVGGSLAERIAREGPLDLARTLRIASQIAAGLAAAHAQGLVHRDIKPANILLENGVERVKITDFGLARAIDDVEITQAGMVAGTPEFMSPEQATGRAVDHRSDLFSLGCVLYAMCAGRSPFRAQTILEAIRRVCEDTPRALDAIHAETPAWLAALVDRLLAKDPDERPQSAAEVAELLERYLAHVQQPGQIPEPAIMGRPPATRSLPRRFRRLAVVAATAAIVLGALGWSEATGVTRLASTVIHVFTPQGALEIAVDDPSVQVIIDGEEIAVQGAGTQEVRLRLGAHQLQAWKDGKTVHEELVTIQRDGKQLVRIGRVAAPAAQGTASEITAAPGQLPAAVEEQTARVKPTVKSAMKSEARPMVRRKFSPPIATISQDGIGVEGDAWRIEAPANRTVRLFEAANPDPATGAAIEGPAMVVYRAKLKTVGVEGRAYLEMWCRFPDGMEYFSKGFANSASGTSDWASYQTPFSLGKGRRPEAFLLNLVIEGKGEIWLKDVEIVEQPSSRP